MKTFEQIDFEIDKLVKDKFFYSESDFVHAYLCSLFSDSEFEELWEEYWNTFNHKCHSLLIKYVPWDKFYYDNYLEISALTRLMVVEDFKLYCYKHRKRL